MSRWDGKHISWMLLPVQLGHSPYGLYLWLPRHSGLIRSALLFAGVLVNVGSFVHVVLANTVARLQPYIACGNTEYCGAC